MELKANLHLHTNDDILDKVDYSLYEVVDHAESLGFSVLAITCHGTCEWTNEYYEYAKSRGIILLKGIEANIAEPLGGKTKHVLVIGADKDVESIKTFAELADYKKRNPHILIIAPHPYHDPFLSLQELAEKHIDLFDAIEYSWFYSKSLNLNAKAVALAKKYNKPIVATSDTHFLDFLDNHYTIIESETADEADIIQSIKQGRVRNVSRPHRFFVYVLIRQALFTAKNGLWRVFRWMGFAK